MGKWPLWRLRAAGGALVLVGACCLHPVGPPDEDAGRVALADSGFETDGGPEDAGSDAGSDAGTVPICTGAPPQPLIVTSRTSPTA